MATWLMATPQIMSHYEPKRATSDGSWPMWLMAQVPCDRKLSQTEPN